MEENARALADVLAVLKKTGSSHVLVGGLAAGFYGRVRATIDVDMLIPRSKKVAIAKELEKKGYTVERFDDMLRAYAPGKDAATEEPNIDLVVRESNPVLKAAAQEAEPAEVLGQKVRLVKCGAFVALKFHAATSRTRKLEDRYQDVTDIGRVLAKSFDDGDLAIASKVIEGAYPGATADLQKLIDDLRHERPVTI